MLGKEGALCAACKGVRRLCGRPVCPILERIRHGVKALSAHRGRELFGATPPSVLVGEWGYPKVRVGLNVPPAGKEEAPIYDDPEGWWGRLGLEDVIRLRSHLFYSSTLADVRVPYRSRLISEIQEAALSSTPVDTEVLFKKPPRVELRFDGFLAPRGPHGVVEKLKVVDNPRVHRAVDRLIDDTDAPAQVSVGELYRAGVSTYYITRIFSLGLLGRPHARRIVPTRWAITAVDKAVGDQLLEKVRDMPELGEYEVYRVEYMGNRYSILLAPGPWSMEMVEIWLPRSVWVKGRQPAVFTVHELYDGRLRGPMDGGYYAMRLPVLEHLYSRGRQATVIAVREVTPDYYAPVGSWQIRESVKHALRGKPERFSSLEEALRALFKDIETPAELAVKEAKLLRLMKGQKKLLEYL